MIPVTIIYALIVSSGILAVGSWIRQKISNRESPDRGFKENSFLNIGMAWMLGYFFIEGFLYLFSIADLFYPPLICFIGIALGLTGVVWIYLRRASLKSILKENSGFELLALTILSAFTFFWNLYPNFNVDYLSAYFPSIQHLLIHGGRHFSVFDDMRLYLSQGENLVYSFGFAWHLHSTLFPQIVHGVTKVITILCVFGACRALGLGMFSLLAPAFIISNEHVIASGANFPVYINMLFMLSLFLTCYGIFIFAAHRRNDYLILAIIAALSMLTCKYLGLYYLFAAAGFVAMLFIYDTPSRKALDFHSNRFSALLFLILAIVLTSLPFLFNFMDTGSPLFPAAVGPFKPRHYDDFVRQAAMWWHYRIGVANALKNLTAFMVWPGVLPTKLLLPLTLFAAIVSMVTKKTSRYLNYGLIFAVISALLTLLIEIYIVFEMRYYRFGITISAMASTFLLAYLFETIVENNMQKFLSKMLSRFFIVAVILFCMKSSFEVMSTYRPSVKNIFRYLTGKESEESIIARYYPDYHEMYENIQAARIDSRYFGLIPAIDWPQTFYPLNGKNIAFFNSAAFPSPAYYDEGLFADALISADIKFVFNEVAQDDYPFAGGAVSRVLEQCGEPINGKKYLLELSGDCLKKMAGRKDPAAAQKRLSAARERMKSLPPYDPFNQPPYGEPIHIVR